MQICLNILEQVSFLAVKMKVRKEDIFRIKNVSKITDEDRILFARFYNKNKDSVDFSNSWFYTVQATIFGGYKYFDGKTLIAFTTKKPDEAPFAITQFLGDDSEKKAMKLAKELSYISKKEVIFKNLTNEQFKLFTKLGCSDYKQGDGWNDNYKYDDDTFPEVIVELEKLIALNGRAHRILRYRINSFYKENYLVEKYSRKYSKDALRVIDKWLKMIKNKYKDYLKEDKIILHSAQIHRKFLELINSGDAGKDFIATLIFVNNNALAFSIGYKLSDSAIGLYTNVTADNSIKGISEAIIFELLKDAYANGYKYANLGGSEFQSLLDYKKKFHPVQYLKKTHAVLY